MSPSFKLKEDEDEEEEYEEASLIDQTLLLESIQLSYLRAGWCTARSSSATTITTSVVKKSQAKPVVDIHRVRSIDGEITERQTEVFFVYYEDHGVWSRVKVVDESASEDGKKYEIVFVDSNGKHTGRGNVNTHISRLGSLSKTFDYSEIMEEEKRSALPVPSEVNNSPRKKKSGTTH